MWFDHDPRHAFGGDSVLAGCSEDDEGGSLSQGLRAIFAYESAARQEEKLSDEVSVLESRFAFKRVTSHPPLRGSGDRLKERDLGLGQAFDR